MYRPRIIPVLLLSGAGLVKSVGFKNHQYIGDPMNAVKLFNDMQADELVFLDISATEESRTISPEMVREIGEEANMPFSVGGGIRTISDIQELIQAGAERVVIGHQAAQRPEFVKEAAERFGSSTISVCVDVKKSFFGKQLVCSKNGKVAHKISPEAYAQQLERLGAGELIVQSVDMDGTMKGFDRELIKQITNAVTIPVVALGGAGKLEHFRQLYQYQPTSGLASGSCFVYQNELKGVLINYPTKEQKRLIYE